MSLERSEKLPQERNAALSLLSHLIDVCMISENGSDGNGMNDNTSWIMMIMLDDDLLYSFCINMTI